MRGSRLVTTERVVCLASPGSDGTVDRLADAVAAHDATLTVRPVGEPLTDDDWIAGKTLGVTVGGDGTFLTGVRAFAPRSIPFFGVNTGTLGFLARTRPADLPAALRAVLRGDATVSERLRFCVTGPGLDATGINEVTVEVPMPDDPVDRKVARLAVVADGEFLGRYEGSGLAVATPTGSTGMALSADGPLQYPPGNRTLQVVGLHTNRLGHAPVVLDADREVRIAADSPVRIAVDGGRPQRRTDAGDVFTVTGASEPAYLVWTPHDVPFFDALAAKLGWGGRRGDRTPRRPSTRRDGDQPADPPLAVRARRAAREAVCAAGEAVLERPAAPDARSTSGRIVAGVLDGAFPDHSRRSFDTARQGDGSHTWLLAPLDGRGNAGRNNPHYAVGLGLLDGDRPVTGAVAAPAFDAVITAGREGSVSRRALTPDDAPATTVGPTDTDRVGDALVLLDGGPSGVFRGDLPDGCECRRLGSPVLALSHVASGRADACLVAGTHPATVAGGVCLVRLAGGRVTDPAGATYRPRVDDAQVSLVASNGAVHGPLLSALSE